MKVAITGWPILLPTCIPLTHFGSLTHMHYITSFIYRSYGEITLGGSLTGIPLSPSPIRNIRHKHMLGAWHTSMLLYPSGNIITVATTPQAVKSQLQKTPITCYHFNVTLLPSGFIDEQWTGSGEIGEICNKYSFVWPYTYIQ